VSLPDYRPNRKTLLALLVPAAGYLLWQRQAPYWTGIDRLDGSIGLVLGLYLCSRPAANGIDLFFAERGSWRRTFTPRSGLEWLALNAVVMLAGWLVLVTGAARLSLQGPPLPALP
jgi:hypothetical protein